MRKNNCELIRRELDELMLDETCSTTAVEHLRECGECHEFYEKQTKLREIVGSLGTVTAPADFDFRLRARLANESSNVASSFNFVASFMSWPVLRRGLVAAVLLLVFANIVFLLGTVVKNRIKNEELAKQQKTASQSNEAPEPKETVTPNKPESPKQEEVAVIPNERPQGNRTERHKQVVIRNTPRLATVDSASIRAEVINGAEPVASSEAFPVDASSLQYFKLSVDDGRGNAKTIFVPTISFGSQRLMQNANQFAPKRVW